MKGERNPRWIRLLSNAIGTACVTMATWNYLHEYYYWASGLASFGAQNRSHPYSKFGEWEHFLEDPDNTVQYSGTPESWSEDLAGDAQMGMERGVVTQTTLFHGLFTGALHLTWCKLQSEDRRNGSDCPLPNLGVVSGSLPPGCNQKRPRTGYSQPWVTVLRFSQLVFQFVAIRSGTSDWITHGRLARSARISLST